MSRLLPSQNLLPFTKVPATAAEPGEWLPPGRCMRPMHLDGRPFRPMTAARFARSWRKEDDCKVVASLSGRDGRRAGATRRSGGRTSRRAGVQRFAPARGQGAMACTPRPVTDARCRQRPDPGRSASATSRTLCRSAAVPSASVSAGARAAADSRHFSVGVPLVAPTCCRRLGAIARSCLPPTSTCHRHLPLAVSSSVVSSSMLACGPFRMAGRGAGGRRNVRAGSRRPPQRVRNNQ